jgi:hypothetical protein
VPGSSTRPGEEADDEHYALWLEATAAYDKMMGMKPASRDGFRAMAQAVLRRCHDIVNRDEWDDNEDLQAGVRLLLRSLAA